MNQHTFVVIDVHGTKVPTADLQTHLRSALRIHGGEIVDTIDDAVLLHMTRATDAVAVSLDAVRTFTRHGASSVRAGLSTGTAVGASGRWSGPVVELAGSVAGHAPRGQVLATGATRQSTDRGQIDFVGIGEHTLPGAPAPVTLYRAQCVTDVGPPGRIDIDPVCHLAVDATQAVRIPGLQDSPAFYSNACATRWSATAGR
jgi:hypothetical protein